MDKEWEELSQELAEEMRSIEEGVQPVPVERLEEGILTESKEKKKRFRMRCKNFFLTFPQCPTTKEVALERIKAKFPNVKALVCHELHQTGDDHLHVLLMLDDYLSVSRNDFFDFIGGKHGKYESARNVRKSVEYITKKGDYISEGINVDDVLKKHGTKADHIAKMLVDGKSLKEVREEDLGFYLHNKRKIEEFATDCALMKRVKECEPVVS